MRGWQHLPNLEFLRFIGNPLTTIHADSLRGITNLRLLSLSGNRIKCLPVNIFSDLPNLSYWLDLSYNHLEYIAPGTLNGMSTRKLFLESNKLKCLHTNSLQGIINPNMYIYMMHNDLKTLNEDTFRNMGSYGVALSGNVMECCSFGWLKESEITDDIESLYYYNLYSQGKFPDVDIPGPNCTDGSDWETLDPNNLPPCTVPIDMICAESLKNPGCHASQLNPQIPACTQTGTSFDCSSQNLKYVPYYINPVTTRINLTHNNIGDYFWHGLRGLSSVRQLDMTDNSIKSLRGKVFSGLPNLRVLILRGNRIDYMTSDVLEGIPKIRKLDLASNEITDVPADFFAPVSDLRWLVLSDNNIGSLDSQLFQYTLKLQAIHLSNNPLGFIPHDLFKNLSHLRFLKLRKTGLASLPMDLSDLISLEWLDVRGNSLTTLTSAHIQNIPLSPQNPFILEIGDNPLVCCPDMLFLRNAADAGGIIWWKNYNQYSSPPQCTDTPWDTLNAVCTP